MSDAPDAESVGSLAAEPVPLRTVAQAFFKVSMQSFGGPAAQISVMHRELVDERRWIGERRFLHALNFCTLMPGPEAQQLATYCGWLLHGARGGLVAGGLFILPGFVVLLLVSLLYVRFGDTRLVASLFAGFAPAVLPIVVQAVQRVGSRALTLPVFRALAVLAFLALFAFGVPFPVVIACAAGVGVLVGRLRPQFFAVRDEHGDGDGAPVPLIADDTLHDAPRTWKRSLTVLAIGLGLWAVPIVGLAIWPGTDSVFYEQATFFSVTAVVTFGGAYAVLSYIGQRAVAVYGWLQPGEMATALALAETTPGPLIQLVQFVAFVGAYRDPGSLDPYLAGLLATIVVVWVTYVPCFLWIFLGAPYMEGLRHNRSLSAALSGVTASIVGVIANLAAYFAVHTLFDSVDDERSVGLFSLTVPEWSSFDWRAVATALFATVLLYRAKTSVARTVLIAGAAGSLLYLTA